MNTFQNLDIGKSFQDSIAVSVFEDILEFVKYRIQQNQNQIIKQSDGEASLLV